MPKRKKGKHRGNKSHHKMGCECVCLYAICLFYYFITEKIYFILLLINSISYSFVYDFLFWNRENTPGESKKDEKQNKKHHKR